MWLSCDCLDGRVEGEADVPSTAWFLTVSASRDVLSICVKMSAHSCLQNFLGYIAAEIDRRRYVDSSSPRSIVCPR